jgi:hypothetical protein
MLKIPNTSWVPVAHACNPSYSGGRDREDQGDRARPYLEEPITKKGLVRAGVVAQVVECLPRQALRPSSKPSMAKKKKKKISFMFLCVFF